MHYLASIIREARRPASAVAGTLQRSELEEPDAPPAAPVEEQEDGGYTIFRFQKEGAARSREVPEGGQRTRSDSVASPASPFEPGGGQSPPVRWQPEEESSVDGNVDEVYVSRRSDLATGKAYDTAERSTFASAGNGSGEVSRVQTSNESTTHGTEAESQIESTTQQSGETFEHRVEQRIRQAPGAGTPSDPALTRADATAPPEAGYQSPTAQPDPATQQAGPATARTQQRRSAVPEASAAPLAPGQPAAAAQPASSRVSRDTEPPADMAGPAADGPRVVIGQVEVVVVGEGRGTGERGGDRGAGRSGSFLSRNYLKRL